MLIYLLKDDKTNVPGDSKQIATDESKLRVIVGIVDWGDLANPWEARYLNL